MDVYLLTLRPLLAAIGLVDKRSLSMTIRVDVTMCASEMEEFEAANKSLQGVALWFDWRLVVFRRITNLTKIIS